jgi:hypothetical protein
VNDDLHDLLLGDAEALRTSIVRVRPGRTGERDVRHERDQFPVAEIKMRP